jgi:hypothetical protein
MCKGNIKAIFVKYMELYMGVQLSNKTCLYVEVVDPKCTDFVRPKDYGSKVTRECRIPICGCILERLKVNGSNDMHNVFPISKIYCPFFCTFALQNLQVLTCILKKKIKLTNCDWLMG